MAPACARTVAPSSTHATSQSASAPTVIDTTRKLPVQLHWFQNSAEYRGIALQTYRAATARVTELSRGLQPGTWAVILDVDETALDNIEFRVRRFDAGLEQTFTDAEFIAWVHERAAKAVPGSTQFTNAVRQLGGRVVYVTNRDDVMCPDTKANLISAGSAVDYVLCRVNRVSDKNPRFEAVQKGAPETGGAPLRVLLWVGDNILDFPALTQAARSQPGGLDLFGDRYFLLPNPLYGSWTSNPQR